MKRTVKTHTDLPAPEEDIRAGNIIGFTMAISAAACLIYGLWRMLTQGG